MKKFFENFIMIVIILAIVEMLLEELGYIYVWQPDLKLILIISGFIFDLIFSIEFIVRSIVSKKRGGFYNYFKNEKGWVDFFSSIPVILCNSGPLVLGFIFPGKVSPIAFTGLLNILKITKIIRTIRILRILRVLRFLRILKFISNIQVTSNELFKLKEKAISVSIVVITLVLIISQIFPGIFYSVDYKTETINKDYTKKLSELYKSIRAKDNEKISNILFCMKNDRNVIFMYYGTSILINNVQEEDFNSYLKKNYFYNEFRVINYLNFKLWYSIRDILIENSRINLLIESIIILLVIALIF